MEHVLVITSDIQPDSQTLKALQNYGSLHVLNDTHNPSHGYGAEINLRQAPVQELRSEFPNLDFNSVPTTKRRKRLLIADMDSTIIPVECIDEVAALAGVKEQVSAITEQAMRGELNFEEALEARVKLLKGIPVKDLETLYTQQISLNPGARILVQTMMRQGGHTALVSGGFTFFSEKVARDAGFAVHHANILEYSEDGHLTGTVALPILGQHAKLESLKTFMQAEQLSENEVLAVGDGANDLMMLKHVEMGVAYRAKPIVSEQANYIVNNKNLCALLYLQGYKSSEFRTTNSDH